MKPVDVVKHIYWLQKWKYEKYRKYKNGNYVILSKYKNIFVKDYVGNWSEEVFVIKKAKYTVTWIYFISELNVEETVGTFYKNQLQKSKQKELKLERVIKTKYDKLHVKWKGYGNSFNSWINKKNNLI